MIFCKGDHHEKLLRGIKEEEKAVLEEASQQMQLKLERAKKLKDEASEQRFKKFITALESRKQMIVTVIMTTTVAFV